MSDHIKRQELDLRRALLDPARAFPSAQSVADDPGLDRNLKIQLLRQWLDDTGLLEVAEGEGMPTSDEPNLGHLHAQLCHLLSALEHGSV